ncbi:MAG TPA: glycosyl hydrolase, partial [Nitrospiraceae bacterium]|nr:glycosyl hydrolase [Nitrospiraceae bacterium]
MRLRAKNACVPKLVFSVLSALMTVGGPGAFSQETDPLAAGFENPPIEARPRVWWHWIDGNVSEDGIRRDLAWLAQIGIGGVHNFDAALTGPERDTPPLVPERVAYLTPRWQEMLRFAVGRAREHGMEFTIAASP